MTSFDFFCTDIALSVCLALSVLFCSETPISCLVIATCLFMFHIAYLQAMDNSSISNSFYFLFDSDTPTRCLRIATCIFMTHITYLQAMDNDS